MPKYPVILCCLLLLSHAGAAQTDCNVHYVSARYAIHVDSLSGHMFYYNEIQNVFEYHIYNHTIDTVTRVYCGNFKTVADTLYLNYNDGKIPAGCKPFLIREFSGNYYIQYFNDGTRKFLWKRPRMGYGS